MLHFKKNILPHQRFYLTKFISNPDAECLIFIHGGPGYNCGIIEYLIEHDNLFELLNYNIVLYDQRTCGRSRNFTENVSHDDNVNDLNEIYNYLVNNEDIKIKGLIGHSYGAKLLFDFYKKFNYKIPGIFISTANSILTPRLNNLIFDLAYLKKVDPIKYAEIFMELEDISLEKIWKLTEELSPFFQKNKDRYYLYWANLECFEKTQHIQDIINLPINTKTFMSVRKDLYSTENNFSVDIDNLDIAYLWINGFHDFVMNGTSNILPNKSNITTFYKSSHYPHIEENYRFSELINAFFNNL